MGSAGGGGDASMQPVGAVLRLRLPFAFGRHSGERQNPGGRESASVLANLSVATSMRRNDGGVGGLDPCGSQFLVPRSELTPHRISLRAKRSASATFPPSSVGNDPQGGSDLDTAKRGRAASGHTRASPPRGSSTPLQDHRDLPIFARN